MIESSVMEKNPRKKDPTRRDMLRILAGAAVVAHPESALANLPAANTEQPENPEMLAFDEEKLRAFVDVVVFEINQGYNTTLYTYEGTVGIWEDDGFVSIIICHGKGNSGHTQFYVPITEDVRKNGIQADYLRKLIFLHLQRDQVIEGFD